MVKTPPTVLLSRQQSLLILENLKKYVKDYKSPPVEDSTTDSQLVTLTPFYEDLTLGTNLLLKKKILFKSEANSLLLSDENKSLLDDVYSPEKRVLQIKSMLPEALVT